MNSFYKTLALKSATTICCLYIVSWEFEVHLKRVFVIQIFLK